MNTYIVELHSAADQPKLQTLGQIGKPRALTEFYILKSTLSLSEIRKTPFIKHAELDHQCDIEAVNDPNPGNWFLSWISNSGGSYQHTKTGEGVDIYILDTGVRLSHSEFEGRASTLWSFDGEDFGMDGPSPFHGTGVASCAAGKTFGTAKKANILNVRIDFMTSTIIKALDRIVEHHLDKPDDRPSILNFSGSSSSSFIGKIFRRCTDYGIVVVAAAGNYSESQPRYPARELFIVSVGSLNSSGTASWFSNRQAYIFAPGEQGLVATHLSDTDSKITSGTSFSSPLYAGLLACGLQGSDKFNTNIHVSNYTFYSQMNWCDLGRSLFDNNSFQVRTASTRVDSAPYYKNSSLLLSDQDINEFCLTNITNPQLIADAAKTNNVSLARLAVATGFPEDVIDQFFEESNVVPWWKFETVDDGLYDEGVSALSSIKTLYEDHKEYVIAGGIVLCVLLLAALTII